MKITAIRSIVVNAGFRNWVFVRVDTDQQGLWGIGEATLEWKTRSVVAAIEELGELVIGADPRDIEKLTRVMLKRHFWPLGPIAGSATSGIELALWDIFGKSLGLPTWRLLGGAVRDRIRVYAHLGMGDSDAVYGSGTSGRIVELAIDLVERGYTAIKLVCIPYTHLNVRAADLQQVADTMRALRENLGEDIDIMVDFHGRCASADTALQYIRAIEPYRPMFVEEPLQPHDLAGQTLVAAKAGCAVASGERLIGVRAFAEVMEAGAASYVQPDICHCGGLGTARKIAALAEAHGVGIAPHNPLGPVACAVALHYAVATPNFVIQEEMTGAVPWFDEVVTTPVSFEDGHWKIPQTAGHGVEINEEAAAKYPAKPEPALSGDAFAADGTVVDW